MSRQAFRRTVVVVTVSGFAMVATLAAPFELEPEDIPRTWDDDAVATFELPLASPAHSPRHVSEAYYYQLPERVIWKSYPIYHPDHEPAGYREGLAQRKPEVIFEPSQLVDDRDWIDAGALVFRAAISFGGPAIRERHVLDRTWYEENGIGLTMDGVFPWARWVIREKGKLEVGNFGCAMCHTRLMPDGSIIEGAQGNYPFDRVLAQRIREGVVPPFVMRMLTRTILATPWIEDPSLLAAMPLEDLAAARAAVPPGAMHRQGTGLQAPAKIPDLIGISERKYLDATGLVRHRDIGDVMRYAAVNQGMDVLASFGGWVPATGTAERPPPGSRSDLGAADRYSDVQLYALARFLYSLEPPTNPNPFDEQARRGRDVFEREGCGECHTPPLYTNNRLIPADGFEPPPEHLEKYDVLLRRVGTDPTLATRTRRGTGYYKVPSLKGVWYRGPFEHSGSVATLEDWFDPARLRSDYLPTGFASADGSRRPVVGHLYGLRLSDEDKRALLAFLRTL